MPSVTSEIGRLRQVLLHRPGIELARLTPENKDRLLFDDILWLERAQEEHDRLAALLVDQGVEVLYVRDLLAEALGEDEVRGSVIDLIVTPAITGERLSEHLRDELRSCEMGRLLDVLFGGLLRSELPSWGIDPLFAGLAADGRASVIQPLPNMMFMRDNAAWIQDGLMFGVLAWPARRPESLLMSAVYRHHPRFKDLAFPTWYGDGEFDVFPATVEGGDVLVIGERTVLVGSGERTAPAAAEALARRLFSADAVDRLIVAHFPAQRSIMHLDTIFTMVDTDAVNVFPHVLQDMEVYEVTPGSSGALHVEVTAGLIPALESALGHSLRLITTGGDAVGSMREQWDDGNNTLAVSPGVVIAYARNTETNRRLRESGVEVLELDASELCRGRGGSRCLTQPVERDPVG